jgi:hypothetical protein
MRGRRASYRTPSGCIFLAAAFFFVIFFNFMSPVHDVDAILNSRSPEQKIVELLKTKQNWKDKKNEKDGHGFDCSDSKRTGELMSR